MTKVTNKKPKTVNPILKGLPNELKTKEMFEKIEKSLAKVLFSDHTHKSIKEYSKCKRCMAKLDRRRALLKEFGFRDYAQYVEWRKVHQIVLNKFQFKIK